MREQAQKEKIREENRKKRFAEKKIAAESVAQDYSSIMKFLIMLASACIGFSATLIHKTANTGIAWAMCFWGGCLFLTISALVYSIWAQMKNIRLLADLKIEYEQIYRRQPPNWPQDLLIIFSFVSFVIGIVVFITVIWPMGNSAPESHSAFLQKRTCIHDSYCHCRRDCLRHSRRHKIHHGNHEPHEVYYFEADGFYVCEGCQQK